MVSFSVVVDFRPVSILLCLFNADDRLIISEVAKRVDSANSYVSGVLSSFEVDGLIVFERVGRVKFIELTDKGKNAADLLNRLRVML